MGVGGALGRCEGARSCPGRVSVEMVWMIWKVWKVWKVWVVWEVWVVWMAVWGGCGPSCSFCGG